MSKSLPFARNREHGHLNGATHCKTCEDSVSVQSAVLGKVVHSLATRHFRNAFDRSGTKMSFTARFPVASMKVTSVRCTRFMET